VAEQPDSLRAADVDREFVAERLRNALSEGRLTLIEYDDRLREAYEARTYGELKGLLADLPDVTTAERSQLATTSGALAASSAGAGPMPIDRGHTRRWVAGAWSGWLSTSLILTAIWFITSVGSDHGHFKNFWPIWFIVPIGAIMLARTITGLAGGEPRRAAEREAQRRAERDARKQAERDERRQRDDDRGRGDKA